MASGTELISEMASPQRMEILQLLSDSNLKTSDIAKKLGTSIQAISRHVDRLHNVRLIKKTEEGTFHLTTVGNVILQQCPFFDFLEKFKDYFETHDFSGIPDHLIARLGDLRNCEFESNQMKGLQRARDWAAAMKKYVKGVTFTTPLEYFDVVSKSVENGATQKLIFGTNSVFPKRFSEYPARKKWLKYKKTNQVQEKIVEFVPLVAGVTENEAHLIFANKDLGYPDCKSIFFSKDPKFMKWCEDLIEYYWNLPEVKNFKLIEK